MHSTGRKASRRIGRGHRIMLDRAFGLDVFKIRNGLPFYKEWDANMGKRMTEFVDLKDVRIAYRQHGSGPVLLLLHGNSESKALFGDYQEKYFPDYHTMALDSRGHGESVSEDEAYSIAQYADDVIAFCKAKGFSRVMVIGYSDGGNIALHLAKKAPQLFPKLAVISPNYLAGGTTDGWLRIFRMVAGLLGFLHRLGFPVRKALLRWNLMLTDIGLTPEDMRSIRTSVRILYAEKDMIKESHILEIGGFIPNATVRKIGHCDHMSIMEKRDTVDDIAKYLKG
jgi:pimeloyl-ACP methyl ester carboxylesterase